MSGVVKKLKINLGALSRSAKEYKTYFEEKEGHDRELLELNTQPASDSQAHAVKKLNEQMQETQACLVNVGQNVSKFYEKVREILNTGKAPLDTDLVALINKAMNAGSAILEEIWVPLESPEEKKDEADDTVEFVDDEKADFDHSEIPNWGSKEVAAFLEKRGLKDAAAKATENQIDGTKLLGMTRLSVTSDLGVAKANDRKALLAQLDKFKGILHTDFVYGVAVLKNTVLSCSNDGTLRRWQLEAGSLNSAGYMPRKHPIICMSVSEDKSVLAIVTREGTDKVSLIDLKENKLLHKFGGLENKVACIAISPDGSHVATGGESGEVVVFGIKSGNLKTKLEGHRKNVMGICWSPDSKKVAAASQDRVRQVRVWDVFEGKLLSKIKCKTLAYGVCWTTVKDPKDDTVAERLVVGEQKAVGVYDPKSGESVLAIPMKAQVWAVAVDPAQRLIATGCSNGVVTTFDLDGKQVQECLGHESNIRALAFVPGQKSLLSASNDRTVRCWKLK